MATTGVLQNLYNLQLERVRGTGGLSGNPVVLQAPATPATPVAAATTTPPTTTTTPDIAVIQAESKSICEEIKRAEETIKYLNGIPEIPTACMQGMGTIEACSKEFFEKSVTVIKGLHSEIQKLKCSLASKELQMADHVRAVQVCARSVQSNLQRCNGSNCAPCGQMGSCQTGGCGTSRGCGTIVKVKKICAKRKTKKRKVMKKRKIPAHRHTVMNSSPYGNMAMTPYRAPGYSNVPYY